MQVLLLTSLKFPGAHPLWQKKVQREKSFVEKEKQKNVKMGTM